MAEKRRRKKTEKLDLQCPKVCLDYDEVPRAVGDEHRRGEGLSAVSSLRRRRSRSMSRRCAQYGNRSVG